jgi:hypothetical protein
MDDASIATVDATVTSPSEPSVGSGNQRLSKPVMIRQRREADAAMHDGQGWFVAGLLQQLSFQQLLGVSLPRRFHLNARSMPKARAIQGGARLIT